MLQLSVQLAVGVLQTQFQVYNFYVQEEHMVTPLEKQALLALRFAMLDVSVKQAQQLNAQHPVPQGFSVFQALGVK